MSSHDPLVTLRQMLGFITEVQGYARGETLSSLLTNRMKTHAFERVMECIGEAVKRLPVEMRERYPAVDWKGSAGLRDWLAHGYDGVDHRILWKAMEERLPGLEQTIHQMLSDLDAKPRPGGDETTPA